MAAETFAELAAMADPRLDSIVLAAAAELGDCDADGAVNRLDALGAEIADACGARRSPRDELAAVVGVLGDTHAFIGNRDDYDDPDNSLLDRVLVRRTGLPILLSIVYIEAARRAGIELGGVGLPGHYVAAHFGADPPLVVDPFAGGLRLDIPRSDVVRWGTQKTVLRVLNNLVGSYRRRHDLNRAIRAAELRLALPLSEQLRTALGLELRSIRASLN